MPLWGLMTSACKQPALRGLFRGCAAFAQAMPTGPPGSFRAGFFSFGAPMPILRIPAVLVETGTSRSQFYASIAAGLFVRPIKVGLRATGIPSEEVTAINRARIAGQTEEQIRDLVRRLEAARQEGLA